ncbi:MAG: hypothetical protein ACSLEY_03965 [Candidatus Saccharimonadales bacterium]
MFTKKSLQEYITLSLCVFSRLGVAVHDTKIDKLAAVGIGTSAVAALHAGVDGLARLTDTVHTHVERISLKNLAFEQPRLQSRYLEDKKHTLQKNVPRGQHSFDGYSMPLI